jgi:hypothetical protein
LGRTCFHSRRTGDGFGADDRDDRNVDLFGDRRFRVANYRRGETTERACVFDRTYCIWRAARCGNAHNRVGLVQAAGPKVGYRGFLEEGSAQKDIIDRNCLGAGSTFSLYLKGGEAEAFRFLDALRIAKLAVSLGGTETLASAPAAMTHLSVPLERKAALGITDNLVRISIGIEDADDLIADFEQALEKV